MPATLGSVNVYLIRGPNGTALIDTGMNDAASRKALTRQLQDRGLGLEDIDAVVCTHHHADHAGLGLTFSKVGASTMMSEEDARALTAFFSNPELDCERATFFKRHQVPSEFEERVSPMFPFFRSLCERFAPSNLLEDGQEIDLGGIVFEVMVTPGHTQGHICLKHDKDFVLTGDCITVSDATHISMRIEVIGTDPLSGFLESLERLSKTDVSAALPGHGPVIEDLSSRAMSIIAHHRTRLAQVERALGHTPRSAYEICIEAIGPRPKVFARWLAMCQTLAYLEHLAVLGRAVEVETEQGLVYIQAR
jgi:glyoxylase-like metal-dependent hydrolase (beta-lactamase superfamily II)